MYVLGLQSGRMFNDLNFYRFNPVSLGVYATKITPLLVPLNTQSLSLGFIFIKNFFMVSRIRYRNMFLLYICAPLVFISETIVCLLMHVDISFYILIYECLSSLSLLSQYCCKAINLLHLYSNVRQFLAHPSEARKGYCYRF